jgi:hypothetical protein
LKKRRGEAKRGSTYALEATWTYDWMTDATNVLEEETWRSGEPLKKVPAAVRLQPPAVQDRTRKRERVIEVTSL